MMYGLATLKRAMAASLIGMVLALGAGAVASAEEAEDVLTRDKVLRDPDLLKALAATRPGEGAGPAAAVDEQPAS